jgi:tetratricopeptide (TPR) repeat protein
MDRRWLPIVAALLLAAGVASAQGDWATLTHNGEYAFARGFYDRAESEFEKALEVAQRFPAGDRRLETSLDNLARLYEHRSDFDKAQPLYQLKLAALEERLGENDPALLDALYDVARVSQPMGDLPTVDAALRRFDVIASASGQADPRQWWQVLAMLSRMEVVREDQAQALAWQRRAVEVLADDQQATEAERAIQLESLAQLELESGDEKRAAALFAETAALRSVDEGADAVSRTLAQGAAAAYGAGRFDTAERLALAALDATPSDGVRLEASTVLADVSWARVNRGTDELDVLLAAAGDGPDLAVAAERLQALVETVDGATSENLRRLVQVETLRGRPGEAAHWQRQLVQRSAAGAAQLSARRDLATLLAAAGEDRAALVENTAVLAALEADLGSDSVRLLPLLEQRLELLTRIGDKREAKRVKKRIKKISR